MEQLETELKQLIVQCLSLDDVRPEEIDVEAPLIEGLSLDSVDALELGMAVSRRYGVKIVADDERARAAFRSVRNLAEFVREKQLEGGVK